MTDIENTPDTFTPVVVTSADIDALNDIASEVMDEALEQLETWGQQDHDLSHGESTRVQYEAAEVRYKLINHARMSSGRITWDGILLEEVYEALGAAEHPEHAREELVQVAAVAVSMIAAIDRLLASFDGEPVEVDVEENDEDAA